MESFDDQSLPAKARLAGALAALVASVMCLGAVLAVFASAAGELDPVLAKAKAPPSASTVASTVAGAVASRATARPRPA